MSNIHASKGDCKNEFKNATYAYYIIKAIGIIRKKPCLSALTYWIIEHWWMKISEWTPCGLGMAEPVQSQYPTEWGTTVRRKTISSWHYISDCETYMVCFHYLQVIIQAFHNALPMSNQRLLCNSISLRTSLHGMF